MRSARTLGRLNLMAIGLLAMLFAPVRSTAQGSSGTPIVYPSLCIASVSAYGWCGTSGEDIGYYVNNAASYLVSVGSGGVIQISAGTYTVNNEIVIGEDDIEVAGTGQNSTKLIANVGSSTLGMLPVFSLQGGNYRIHDLMIINGGANPTPQCTTSGTITCMDGIDCKSCNHVEFDHLTMGPIAGQYGIATTDSNNVYIHDNTITNFGYGGIMNLLSSATSSSNIVIERNNVSNCSNTLGSPALCYGISIAGSTTTVPPNTINGYVRDNIVSNITRWECYDSHGGSNQIFEGNSCTNSYYGIMAGAVAGGSLTHVTIRNNHLERGTGNPGGYGIVLAGGNYVSPVVEGLIDNNYVDGYGSAYISSLGQVGAITIFNTQNLKITNNTCPTYNQACVTLYQANLNTTITGNTGGSMLGAASSQASAVVEVSNAGSYGMLVDANVSNAIWAPGATPPTYAPVSLFFDGYQASQVNFGPNNELQGSRTPIAGSLQTANYTGGAMAQGTIGSTCTLSNFGYSSTATGLIILPATYSTPTAIPMTATVLVAAGAGATAAPTSATVGNGTATCSGTASFTTSLQPVVAFTGLAGGGNYPMALSSLPVPYMGGYGYQSGTVGYDLNYRPAYIFSAPASSPYYANGGGGGFYSLDTSTLIAMGMLTSTSPNTMTVSGGMSSGAAGQWLPVGMNVSIANAATSTTPLLARVISNDGTTVTLDQNAGNIPSGATPVTWQGGQVTSVVPLTGTTSSFSVPALNAGSCGPTSGTLNTATVPGAQVGQHVTANLAAGSALYFPSGLYQIQAAVTAPNIVTVDLCAIVNVGASSPSVQFNVAVQ